MIEGENCEVAQKKQKNYHAPQEDCRSFDHDQNDFEGIRCEAQETDIAGYSFPFIMVYYLRRHVCSLCS